MKDTIKTMQLYTEAERILVQLRANGITDDDPLEVETVARFDQLHYHGTETLDEAIARLKLTRGSVTLEIGSGWGGPSRYIAYRTGAAITAVELQRDYHDVGLELTRRTGLADRVTHVNADYLELQLPRYGFDAIVSWLALYHIPERPVYLKKTHDLLRHGGKVFFEDLVLVGDLSTSEAGELNRKMFANSLIPLEAYPEAMGVAGFEEIECTDMTDDWAAFTKTRLESFRAGRKAYEAIHGAEIYAALHGFYETISGYFERGIIGGVRAVAART